MANYGTVSSHDAPTQNGSAHPADEETAALLGGKANEGSSSVGKRFRRHMSRNVSNAWGDLALLFCYIITGLLDSCSVFIWGSFLSMQTGTFLLDALRRKLYSLAGQATRYIWA
jgi:hypothetical protein